MDFKKNGTNELNLPNRVTDVENKTYGYLRARRRNKLEDWNRHIRTAVAAAAAASAAANSLQSCPTLCDPIGGSPPGSPVPGILQARTLEWVAISFSNA